LIVNNIKKVTYRYWKRCAPCKTQQSFM